MEKARGPLSVKRISSSLKYSALDTAITASCSTEQINNESKLG